MKVKIAAPAAALALALASMASAAPIPQPPLRPGEMIVVLADNCSLILEAPDGAAEQVAQARQAYRQARWGGECRNGLAHGDGAVSIPQPGGAYELPGPFHFGRREPVYQTPSGEAWYATRAGMRAGASPEAELDNPVWRQPPGRAGDPGPTMIVAGNQRLETYIAACAAAGCRPEYGVRLVSLRPGGAAPVSAPCPDPHAAAGCEALWRRLAASFLPSYRQVREQAIADLPGWRAEIARLNAPREARLAALDAASLSAIEWTLMAARTEAAAGDDKDQLDNGNAGQLFAMADERRRASDNAGARRALRALLTRFPDHALAVPAAEQLSSLGADAPAACNAPAEEARLAARLSEAMRRIPQGEAVQRLESVLFTLEQSAAAYARCASQPSHEAKIRTYTTAYVETARLCAQIAPDGECRARMH